MNLFRLIGNSFKARSLFLVGTTFLFALYFSSCFTGIESTKKINLSREDKKNLIPTKEEAFMEQIIAQPLKFWPQGKQFVASDNRALIVIVPTEGLLPYPPDSIKGTVLQFVGLESKMNAAGNINVVLKFSDGTYLFLYDTGKVFDDAMDNLKSDQIPMLIDMDMVEQARNILVGQKIWSRSNLWYDKFGNRIPGRKYVEVTVEDVIPGNMVFPLQLQIRSEDDESAFVFINFGNAGNDSRAFHNLFSFSDIRKHYPGIDSESWKLISRGEVKIGMTKEESRLALGNPSDLASGHDYSQTLDVWTYEDGRTLWFEDGRLVKIRQ